LEESAANLEERLDNLNRTKLLYDRRVIGQEDWVKAQQQHRAAAARKEHAAKEHDLLMAGAWKADLDITETTVGLATSQRDQAKTELERHRVTAPQAFDDRGRPVDLEVLQVNVRPGEYVGAAAGQALVMLGNLDELHVRVDIDEYDIPRFRTEAPARATVRGGTGREYALKFRRVEPFVIPKKSLTGDSAERVDTRVLQVIYCIAEKSDAVFVGQQMDVYIDLTPERSEPAPSTEARPFSPIATVGSGGGR
ncbi:MAG TPA: HlyD family efflux transporter periplasmic adaptor subunit, partial [Planctomycetia bacterium]|nr:HlyD family efflux transporter periplasmic adaptor subunit [Planctomycetia bacterium]